MRWTIDIWPLLVIGSLAALLVAASRITEALAVRRARERGEALAREWLRSQPPE